MSVLPARLPCDADTTATSSPGRTIPDVSGGAECFVDLGLAGRRGVDRERAHTPHEAEPAERVGLVGDAGDRHRRPERGDAARRRAALGRAHDRGDAEILGGLNRRVRDGPRDPIVVVGRRGAGGRRALPGQPSAASATSAIVRTVSVG